MTRSQLAEATRSSRGTIAKFLRIPGAPKPDEKHRISRKAFEEFRARNETRVGSNETMRAIKEAQMRLDLEERELDLAIKKGRYIDKEKIRPTVAAVMTELTANLRMEFEQSLPRLYEGKNLIERTKLNGEAIVRVMGKFKQGNAPIT